MRTLYLRTLDRALIAAALLMALVLLGVQAAHAAEIIPSIGVTKAVHDGDLKTFGGLALRSGLVPMVSTEIGVGYRTESRNNDDLTVKMVPITASLWVSPFPTLYAGGGVGLYHTTLDYAASVPFEDQTTNKFGYHLGGGFRIPLALVALDFNGRYIFLDKQKSELPPNTFDPDFWSASAGLAIKF
jgi:hypothetical protein